jgi:glutathione S-transferase
MPESPSQFRIYGVPFSQPVRAVMWLMFNRRQPFEMVLVNPGSKGDNGSRNPGFVAKNPAGTIPTLENPQTGFVLGEAHAILCYLCRHYEWTDMYPLNPEACAAVDWYLHFHHRNIRDASVALVAPRIRKDLDISQARQRESLATVKRALDALEAGWLMNTRYIAGDNVTIADLAAYVEIGQLQPRFTNLFDFAPYPNIRRWLTDMQQVDGHDETHIVLTELGDISREAPSMDTIKNANKSALRALKQLQT